MQPSKIYILKEQKQIPLGKEWINLINYVTLHPFSDLAIEFKDGKPTMIRAGIESIKL